MSNIIDSKVVELKFDTTQFEKGARSAMDTLASLKKGLVFDTSKGAASLADLSKAASKVDLSNVSVGAEKASSALSSMQAVGVAAFVAISAAAAATAYKIATSFKSSISEGFSDYNLKIGATQTIMAGTGESIGFVTEQLKELDIYADQTIYSLSDMTSNIGKFTNAGVKLPVAVNAMKGISNVAALAGAGTSDAARAMYNLGQAIGQGTVRMMDWRSVENANMGTKQFKEQLINTAVAMGQLEKSTDGTITTAEGSEVTYKNFGTTLQDLWLTSDVLTTTLDKFADKTTKIGKAGYKAATQIKTLPMLFETLRAAAGTGWTDTFEIVLGNLPQAVKLWTEVGDVAGAAIAKSADARNEMLRDWKALGGRKAMIDALRNAFQALVSIVKPIKDAFREIFPAATGRDLYNITVAVRDFFEKLKMGEDSMSNLKSIFTGVFSVFAFVIDVIKGAVGAIFDLFGAISISSEGFLDAAGSVGDFITSLRDTVKRGKFIEKFFDGIVDLIVPMIEYVQTFIGVLGDLLSHFKLFTGDAISAGIENFGVALKNAKSIGEKVGIFFQQLGTKTQIAGKQIGDIFGEIKEALSNSITPADFDRILETIKVGLGAGIFLTLRKFLTQGFGGVTGGFLENINSVLGEVTNTLKTMQGSIKANIILKIAIALGILAVSLALLSMIDGDKLAKALFALGTGFAILAVGLASLSKALGPGGAVQLPLLALSMGLLAGGLLLLAVALKVFATIDPEELAQAFIALAGGLLIIRVAMTQMAAAKGDMVRASASLLMIGLALIPIAVALKIFASMDLGDIAASLLTLVVSLSVITNVLIALPEKKLMGAAAAVGIVGASLIIVGGALKLFASMSWEEIAKGLITLGGALAIISVGLIMMEESKAGSYALLIAAGALAILAPVLFALGNMPWQVIVTGLLTIAGVFVVLGLAGLILQPLAPIIAMLASSIFLIGVGMALAGPAAIALATAFSIVVTAIVAGSAAFAKLAEAVSDAIPGILRAVAEGIIEMAKVIVRGAPHIMEAFTAILESIAKAIVDSAPDIANALWTLLKELVKLIVKVVPLVLEAIIDLLTAIFRIIADKGPELVAEFARMIINLIEEWNKHVDEVTEAVANFVVKMLGAMTKQNDKLITAGSKWVISVLEGVGKNLEDIVDAATKLVIDFINALATAIEENAAALRTAGGRVASAIIGGITGGLFGGTGEVTRAASSLGTKAVAATAGAIRAQSPSKEFEKVGRWGAQGFAKGLVGGKDEILAAWDITRSLLRAAMEGSKADVERLKEKLKELNDAKDKDLEKIRKTERALSTARNEYERSSAAMEAMGRSWKRNKEELIELGKEYDKYTAKIERADQKLQNAIQTRDDYKRSIREQYGDLPDITEETGLEDYMNQLEYANNDIVKFAEVLQELRDMGLTDALYEEFLAEGPDILPFLEELRNGGKESVTAINDMSKDLAREARKLGRKSSKELYQAGVDAARGLVQGLRAQRRAIEEELAAIARAMQMVLKNKLQIKSPSQVMEEIGGFAGKGLAVGLKNSASTITSAAEFVGDSAVTTLRDSLSGVAALVEADMNLNPTITPVLDLSAVRKDASQLDSLLPSQRLALDAAYMKANYASMGYQDSQSPSETTTDDDISPPGGVVFNQNNYSPKALSTAEIYRQTNSQLSRAKGVLTDVTPRT